MLLLYVILREFSIFQKDDFFSKEERKYVISWVAKPCASASLSLKLSDTLLVTMAVLTFLRRLMYGSLHNNRPSVIKIEVKFRYEILFVLNVINSFLSFQ